MLVRHGLLMGCSPHYVEHISHAQAQSLLQKRLKELVIVGGKVRGEVARRVSTEQAAKA